MQWTRNKLVMYLDGSKLNRLAGFLTCSQDSKTFKYEPTGCNNKHKSRIRNSFIKRAFGFEFECVDKNNQMHQVSKLLSDSQEAMQFLVIHHMIFVISV